MSDTPRRRPGSPRPRAGTDELERSLQRLLGDEAAPVSVVDRRPLAYSSTFPVEEIVAWTANGGEGRLVFKDLSRSGPTDPGWRLRARFLHDPLREIECYRDVLAPRGISAPAYLGAVIEPERERYWLFLERVKGDPLWQVGDLETWCRAARWLAGMHSCFAGRTRELSRRLLVLDAGHWQRWLQRARRLALGPGKTPCPARELERLVRGHESATAWAAAQPVTFLHGEFYPSNVLVERRARRSRIRPLDWEMAATGPGLLDLAALTSGGWEDAERAALVDAYRLGLPPRLRPSADELRRGLDHCRLLLAVQWLGWSPDWAPPPEHDHDWLGTALELTGRVAERRGLEEAAR